jgi:hypothetical protein
MQMKIDSDLSIRVEQRCMIECPAKEICVIFLTFKYIVGFSVGIVLDEPMAQCTGAFP